MTEFTLIEAANGAKPKVMGIAYSGHCCPVKLSEQ